jgi:hypothetical protein
LVLLWDRSAKLRGIGNRSEAWLRIAGETLANQIITCDASWTNAASCSSVAVMLYGATAPAKGAAPTAAIFAATNWWLSPLLHSLRSTNV